jgi:hypothetical protein
LEKSYPNEQASDANQGRMIGCGKLGMFYEPLPKSNFDISVHNPFAEILKERGKAGSGKFFCRFTKSCHAVTDDR